jgi:hypothetical protein
VVDGEVRAVRESCCSIKDHIRLLSPPHDLTLFSRSLHSQVRAAFPPPPPLKTGLGEDQLELVRRGLRLEDGITHTKKRSSSKGSRKSEASWTSLQSPTPHAVSMWAKRTPRLSGQRNIWTGRATCVVDTSAREAAAWLMAYCSRERMQISEEEGNPGTPPPPAPLPPHSSLTPLPLFFPQRGSWFTTLGRGCTRTSCPRSSPCPGRSESELLRQPRSCARTRTATSCEERGTSAAPPATSCLRLLTPLLCSLSL